MGKAALSRLDTGETAIWGTSSMGERYLGMVEVKGSTPLCSTTGQTGETLLKSDNGPAASEGSTPSDSTIRFVNILSDQDTYLK